MNRNLNLNWIILITFSIFMNTNHLNAQVYNGTKLVPGHAFKVEDKNIKWEVYDSTSMVSADQIELKDIQGTWKAYTEITMYDSVVTRIELSKPYIFEVKGNKARRDSYDSFIPFSLRKNFIVMIDDHKMISGIINKISPTELTITWKNEFHFKYIRDFYKKK
jgi:hypothetical protein